MTYRCICKCCHVGTYALDGDLYKCTICGHTAVVSFKDCSVCKRSFCTQSPGRMLCPHCLNLVNNMTYSACTECPDGKYVSTSWGEPAIWMCNVCNHVHPTAVEKLCIYCNTKYMATSPNIPGCPTCGMPNPLVFVATQEALDDFAGMTEQIPLDPKLSPSWEAPEVLETEASWKV